MSIFDSKDIVTALELVEKLPDLFQAGRSGSLIEYTRPTRVEPICLVDSRVMNLPYIDSIVHTALNNFVAYYLQAVAITVNVGDVNVIRLLDKLNPNRDPIDSLVNNDWSRISNSMESVSMLALESESPYTQEADMTSTTVNQQIQKFNETANLSVGKLVEVNIERCGQRASFPIQARLRTMVLRSDVLTSTLSMRTKGEGFKEMYHGWRSGQKRFFEDIIFVQDKIDEHRKNLQADSSGFYKANMDRRRKNRISAILSGNPSVSTASSIYIISSDTAVELEREMRGKLGRFRDREKLFEDTYGMMLFVVDADYEMVTVYNRSIEEPTEITIRDIQRLNKNGKGPDITEILNAMRATKAPNF